METKNQKVNEILTAHGLDFTIEKAPMFALNAKNEKVESSYFGLINSKTQEVLYTCKKGYTPSQNHEVVELVLKGMENFGSELSVSNAGSLNGGRKIFLQLAIEGKSKVANDTIERFVTILDSNDGSTGLGLLIGDTTMSCQNKFFKFYKKSQNKMRHSITLEEKMKAIPSLIEEALSESLKQIIFYNKLANTEITKKLADEIVKHVLGFDRLDKTVLKDKSTRSLNIMASLYDNIEHELNEKGLNLWGLHSGITRFTTHDMSVGNYENAKVGSILIGGAYKMNQKSLQFATNKVKELELV